MLFSWCFLLCSLLCYGLDGTQSTHVPHENWMDVNEELDGVNTEEYNGVLHNVGTGTFFIGGIIFDQPPDFAEDYNEEEKPMMMLKRKEKEKEEAILSAQRLDVLRKLKRGEKVLDNLAKRLGA